MANGSGLPRGKQELGLIGGQQIGQGVWDSFGIGLVAPVLDPAFLPQNEERFSLGGAAHEPFREDFGAGIRAGERKTFCGAPHNSEFQRELIVENTRAGLAAARKRGRRGGRPRVLDKEKTRVAEAMLKDTVNYPFVGDVIDHLRIGRTAFYRYFPPDRIRELRNQA